MDRLSVFDGERRGAGGEGGGEAPQRRRPYRGSEGEDRGLSQVR